MRSFRIEDDNTVRIIYHFSEKWPSLYVTLIEDDHVGTSSGANVCVSESDHESESEDEQREYIPSFSASESDDYEDEDFEEEDISFLSGSGHHIYSDIGHSERVDYFPEMPQKWDGDINSIHAGTHFRNKKELVYAVTIWSASNGVEYRTKASNQKTWDVYCVTAHDKYPKELLHNTYCYWAARGSKKPGTGTWELTKWYDNHVCPGSNLGNMGRNVTSRLIARMIESNVRADPEYSVASVQVDVNNYFRCQVTYKKAWHARRLALESIYGD